MAFPSSAGRSGPGGTSARDHRRRQAGGADVAGPKRAGAAPGSRPGIDRSPDDRYDRRRCGQARTASESRCGSDGTDLLSGAARAAQSNGIRRTVVARSRCAGGRRAAGDRGARSEPADLRRASVEHLCGRCSSSTAFCRGAVGVLRGSRAAPRVRWRVWRHGLCGHAAAARVRDPSRAGRGFGTRRRAGCEGMACWIPARRALASNPMDALRAE